MGADRKHAFTEAEALETIARYNDLIVFIGGEEALKNCDLPVRIEDEWVSLEWTQEDYELVAWDRGPTRLKREVFKT